MKRMLVTGLVLVLAALAIRSHLEKRAAEMLVVATEMFEDGECERSLEHLRELSARYGWTEAARQAEELRVQVRQRIVAARQEAESRRQLEQAQQEFRRQLEREAEHERRMEERRLRTEQGRSPNPTPQPWGR